jgi:hypothetical protein
MDALKSDQSFLQPVLSKDSLMRDPCIIKGADGLFHMVWTVSWNQRGIGYANSNDWSIGVNKNIFLLWSMKIQQEIAGARDHL